MRGMFVVSTLVLLVLAEGSAFGKAAPVGYVTVDVGGGVELSAQGTGVLIGGLRGYAVVTENVHVGGFVLGRGSWTDDSSYEALISLALGASGRFGGFVGRGLWLGGEVDAGVTAAHHVVERAPDRASASPPAFYGSLNAVLQYLRPVGELFVGFEARMGVDFLFGGSLDERGRDWSGSGPIGAMAPLARLGFTLGF